MYTMLHNHTKIPSVAYDLAPHSKTTTFCLSFCLHPSSMFAVNEIADNLMITITRGDSNSLENYYFCVQQAVHVIISFWAPFCAFLSHFYMYLLSSHSAIGKGKAKAQKWGLKKEITTWTAVHNNCKFYWTIGLASDHLSSCRLFYWTV